MNSYQDLDINERINFKAALAAWSRYAVAHFGESLDKNLYGLRTARKSGVQRSVLGAGYRFGRGRPARTNALKQRWWQAPGANNVVLEFLLYGRFVDMGVGRGTSHTDRLVSRQLREGRAGRTAKRWYAKRKAYEVKRLREILADMTIRVPLDLVENALTLTLNRSL
ncbi:hypothetical protein FAES_3622 [Fibrella aestuarina BUZ 2]|uniref:Uncharacterized protein n=1 Tax=Fibrella aestuarina BUZ 2 TaxID=1166018 RepID=I0KBX6_9BACT|nr:hypothetical protein [Fibrella aestuarina]CCH01629.1 hypothetical protein FAES_3622 [Fibrella aestuarina BUZ 2]